MFFFVIQYVFQYEQCSACSSSGEIHLMCNVSPEPSAANMHWQLMWESCTTAFPFHFHYISLLAVCIWASAQCGAFQEICIDSWNMFSAGMHNGIPKKPRISAGLGSLPTRVRKWTLSKRPKGEVLKKGLMGLMMGLMGCWCAVL